MSCFRLDILPQDSMDPAKSIPSRNISTLLRVGPYPAYYRCIHADGPI